MSTYTDLKNRVKETITVGFRPEDRVTTQKVRFYNEENEYWGSFSGRLNGEISISKGELSSVDVYDATLVNPVLKTSGGLSIELGTIGSQVEEISTDVYDTIPTKLSSIEKRLSGVPADAGAKISALTELAESFG